LTLFTVGILAIAVIIGYFAMRDVVRVGNTISFETTRDLIIAGKDATITGSGSTYFMLRNEKTGDVIFAVPPVLPSTEWIMNSTEISEGYWIISGIGTFLVTGPENVKITLVEQDKSPIGTIIVMFAFIIWFLVFMFVFDD